MPFTSYYLTCAGREIHYPEWGVTHAPVVIARHGLARTGRDMKQRIQSLILNDTALQVSVVAINRIRSYAGSPPAFNTVRAVAALDRNLNPPPARRQSHAVLPTCHGAAIHQPARMTI